jgi:putative tryptophan/tyrosine transport system ATP-binding protein
MARAPSEPAAMPARGWALGGRTREQMRDRVAGLGMGLENRLDTAIGLLSGGQRQDLTLLLATLIRPKLLLGP